MKNTNNVSLLCLCYVVAHFIAISVTFATASNQFKVGESMGWREPVSNDTAMYSRWAAKNRFQVGDSLYFEYKDDSVLVVDKFGYYHCNVTKPISSFKNGKTIVKLNKPGPSYFISGVPDHCKNGQKLVVDVLALHPTAPPPSPSVAVPPQPYYPMDVNSPAPSPLSNSGFSITVNWVPAIMALVSTTLVSMICAAP